MTCTVRARRTRAGKAIAVSAAAGHRANGKRPRSTSIAHDYEPADARLAAPPTVPAQNGLAARSGSEPAAEPVCRTRAHVSIRMCTLISDARSTGSVRMRI
jgi:hypothetical protein